MAVRSTQREDDGHGHEGPSLTTPPAEAAHSFADRRRAWLLVAGQFILLALVALLPSGDAWHTPTAVTRAMQAAEVAGIVVLAIAAVGLGRGLTAAPLPNAHAELRTGGLYRLVRHPIYSGLLLFAVARSIASGSWWVALACAALIALLNVKARWEEQHLSARFAQYDAYAQRTPRFIPRLAQSRRTGTADP